MQVCVNYLIEKLHFPLLKDLSVALSAFHTYENVQTGVYTRYCEKQKVYPTKCGLESFDAPFYGIQQHKRALVKSHPTNRSALYSSWHHCWLLTDWLVGKHTLPSPSKRKTFASGKTCPQISHSSVGSSSQQASVSSSVQFTQFRLKLLHRGSWVCLVTTLSNGILVVIVSRYNRILAGKLLSHPRLVKLSSVRWWCTTTRKDQAEEIRD